MFHKTMLLAAILLSLTMGCAVRVDRFEPAWVVRESHLGSPQVIHEGRKLNVGMSAHEVESIAGDLLVKPDDPSLPWELKTQFSHLSPLESRRVFLYLTDNMLSAIIVRGAYMQYP